MTGSGVESLVLGALMTAAACAEMRLSRTLFPLVCVFTRRVLDLVVGRVGAANCQQLSPGLGFQNPAAALVGIQPMATGTAKTFDRKINSQR